MEFLKNIDFTNLGTLLLLYLFLFMVILLRFLIISGAYYSIFSIVFRKRFEKNMLVSVSPKRQQLKREVILSILSALIFGLMGLLLLIIWHYGLTKIYLDVSDHQIWYIPISIVIFLALHDTYYYWLHRWMHASKLLRFFHMEHHKSINTTVLTAFSFHPIESFLQALVLPILFMVIPMHIASVGIVLTIMSVSATINHGGVAVFSKSKWLSRIKELLIGAAHHDLHHRNAKHNLGLYFTFWDRIMKTEYPENSK